MVLARPPLSARLQALSSFVQGDEFAAELEGDLLKWRHETGIRVVA
jgi:hypothetical protein